METIQKEFDKRIYGTGLDNVVKNDLVYEVYETTWYGKRLFFVCEEVIDTEDMIICKTDDNVVAILPKKYLRCVTSTHLQV